MFQHQNPQESFADNDMPIITITNVMQPIPVKRPRIFIGGLIYITSLIPSKIIKLKNQLV